MKLGRYKRYKKSNLSLLDEIPFHWEVNRIKDESSVKGRVGWKALKSSEYVKSGYFFLSTPNIKYTEIDYKNVNYITKERYLESPEIMLQNGDVLLVKDGSTLGIVNIIKNLPSQGTVNSSIAVLRYKKQNSKYNFYLLKSYLIQDIINQKKEGMGVPHLFQKDINNFPVLIPPSQEQIRISNFLDDQTQKIDKKIICLGKKRKKYEELKISLINESVTLGINKKTELKTAGIDWISRIPKHWKLARINGLFKQRNEKVSDKYYPPLSVTKKGIVPQLKNAAKTKHGDNRRKVLINDFVINSRSDRKGSSGLSNYKGSVSVINIVLSPNDKVFGRYYHYLFRSNVFTEEFYKQGQGIVDDLWSTKFSSMKIIEVCQPPMEEQIAISDYLDVKTSKIDVIVDNIHKQIESLKELRKTLINDVVTGKIKVS
ncbi:restriction endonuclease subunit S [Aquimarina spinulae]|uniref:restriction endonuclease subunit S n=1 Tax=Aquimarina spinulae TaxID=1192023 RepID=UPI000D55E675|nr:restriction endonuclease subunit S [Aquimarina spinulae]